MDLRGLDEYECGGNMELFRVRCGMFFPYYVLLPLEKVSVPHAVELYANVVKHCEF